MILLWRKLTRVISILYYCRFHETDMSRPGFEPTTVGEHSGKEISRQLNNNYSTISTRGLHLSPKTNYLNLESRHCFTKNTCKFSSPELVNVGPHHREWSTYPLRPSFNFPSRIFCHCEDNASPKLVYPLGHNYSISEIREVKFIY